MLKGIRGLFGGLKGCTVLCLFRAFPMLKPCHALDNPIHAIGLIIDS